MEPSSVVRDVVKADSLREFATRDAIELVNLSLYNNVLRADETLSVFNQRVAITRDTILVFADLAPQYNWAHPCEYYLYDADTGERYEKIDASFPPPQLQQDTEYVEEFHAPIQLLDTQDLRARRRRAVESRIIAPDRRSGERYAILFSGGSNNRHVNDMEFLYRTLIDVYAFDPAHVHVLNHDGTVNYDGNPKPIGNWPGDHTAYRMQVNGQGTRADFRATLTTLAKQFRPEDLLFIHTNNHGAGPGDGVNDFCLCAYSATGGWDAYYANDFVSDLGVLPNFDVLVVMMEQCRSGGFIGPIINHSPARWTHVATAVQAGGYSLGGDNFDPFAEDWIAALTGRYPNGDGLAQVADFSGDGRISASEAFHYADAVHHNGDSPSSAGTGVCIFLDRQLRLCVQPRSIGFGAIPQFDCRVRTISITNRSRESVQVSIDASAPNRSFYWDGLNKTLRSDESIEEFLISFNPRFHGSFRDELSVVAHPGGTHRVRLRGEGLKRPPYDEIDEVPY